jgi:hypothetical protein
MNLPSGRLYSIHMDERYLSTNFPNRIQQKKQQENPAVYFVSRCAVVRFSLGQYFFSSRRSGLFRLFFFEI